MFQTCPSRATKGGGLKKMHSSTIYKGYAVYKIDGKRYMSTTELYVVSICRKCLLRIPFIPIQRYATYFFIDFFFPSMNTVLFFLHTCCVFFFFWYIFYRSHLTGHMCVFVKHLFNFMHFSFPGHSEKQ